MSDSITQDMKYRQSLMKYAEKYGVSRASRKYNKGRSYIYFWRSRWDGTIESLVCQSRKPHRHLSQHTEHELKLIRDMRRRSKISRQRRYVNPNPMSKLANRAERLFQYTAIDEYSRYRILGAYPEQSTYSSAEFLKKVVREFARLGVKVECVQTDKGFEFTNRFSNSQMHKHTLFEKTAMELGIRHKLIRPYTPRHNGKVAPTTGLCAL